jgi:hypothetical protein
MEPSGETFRAAFSAGLHGRAGTFGQHLEYAIIRDRDSGQLPGGQRQL